MGFAGGVVVVWVVNAGVVVAAEIQIVSNDSDGKPCRIGNIVSTMSTDENEVEGKCVGEGGGRESESV